METDQIHTCGEVCSLERHSWCCTADLRSKLYTQILYHNNDGGTDWCIYVDQGLFIMHIYGGILVLLSFSRWVANDLDEIKNRYHAWRL